MIMNLVNSLEKKINETEKMYEEASIIGEERLKRALDAESKVFQPRTTMQSGSLIQLHMALILLFVQQFVKDLTKKGKFIFIMGLQFHPARMRKLNSNEFDYPKCHFAYKKKLNSLTSVKKPLILNKEMENKRKVILHTFSLAKILYSADIVLSVQQHKKLKQMGATMRNAGPYIERLKLNQEREKLATKVMKKMCVEQLSDLLPFYHSVGQICNELLKIKIHGLEIAKENECIIIIHDFVDHGVIKCI
ncbi:hypothetical protein PIB30_004028 [Stylosanthes scabra]|uniref:Uncharacterized protein n=1 Tax=Stylosanthes scabra TaxID=79078 RepID=A0ABU6X384_9FABA|nr:hypothetical protein [Stylosanthes scabra]